MYLNITAALAPMKLSRSTDYSEVKKDLLRLSKAQFREVYGMSKFEAKQRGLDKIVVGDSYATR